MMDEMLVTVGRIKRRFSYFSKFYAILHILSRIRKYVLRIIIGDIGFLSF